MNNKATYSIGDMLFFYKVGILESTSANITQIVENIRENDEDAMIFAKASAELINAKREFDRISTEMHIKYLGK